MDTPLQSSFIPKDASSAAPLPRRTDSGGLPEVLFLVALVLLVASGALAGAVFLYGQYVQSSSASKVDQLKRAQAAFDPTLIEQITRLDDRMRVAESILSAHVAPTALFDALQQTTLSTISFKTLDFLSSGQTMTLKMQGVAQGVNSIALEGDILSKSGIIVNPIFSDISREGDGVHFTLVASVNPAAINYVKLINASGAASAAASTQNAPAQNGVFGPQQAPAQTQQTSSQSPQLPTN